MLKVNYYQELSKKGNKDSICLMNPTMIDRIIGSNLRRLRKEKKLSQKQLGDMINNEKTKISALENANEGMGKELMARFCNVLNVKPYEFYIEDDTPIAYTELQLKVINIIKEAEKFDSDKIKKSKPCKQPVLVNRNNTNRR